MRKLLLLFVLFLTVSLPASAQFTFPINHFSVSGTGFLDDVIDSVCGQIDATIAASIADDSPVSETFLNIIDPVNACADGSAQSGGDFFNGMEVTTDGDELALSGAAGTDTNFLSGDGSNDMSRLDSPISTTALTEAHRTDIDGTWIAYAFRADDTDTTDIMFANQNPGGLGVQLAHFGGTGEVIGFDSDSGAAGSVASKSTTTITDGVDYLVVVSWDGTSSTNNLKFWINSDTATDTLNHAFQTSTSSTTKAWGAHGQENGFVVLGASARTYGWAWGNEFLDDTKAAVIRTWYNDNHAGTRY